MPSSPSAVLDSGAASGGGGSAQLPSVAAATAGVDAATAARRVAGLRPNPEVQAQVENLAGTGVYKGLRSSETTVGVALPLELGGKRPARVALATRSEEHTSELQSLMRISYAVFCLKK